jgi:hypothetical protein
MNSHQASDRADSLFKKKQERLREGQLAMAEYQAARRATDEKTVRLRALRLARDAADNQPGAEPTKLAKTSPSEKTVTKTIKKTATKTIKKRAASPAV